MLLTASFHRERVIARRLARNEGLAPALALQQVLESVAGDTPLADFINIRQRASEIQLETHTLRRDAARLRHWARHAARETDPAAWQIWFDGSAIPNPGRLGLGALLQAPDGHCYQYSLAGGEGDNNDAEYLALILALEQALPMHSEALVVYGDSRIVIDDVLGLLPVVSLERHRLHARRLLARFTDVRLVWIPRARNTAADALARAALTATVTGLRSKDAVPSMVLR